MLGRGMGVCSSSSCLVEGTTVYYVIDAGHELVHCTCTCTVRVRVVVLCVIAIFSHHTGFIPNEWYKHNTHDF